MREIVGQYGSSAINQVAATLVTRSNEKPLVGSRRLSNQVVDRWTVVGASTLVTPCDRSTGVDDDVSAELKCVFALTPDRGPFKPMACFEEFPITLCRLQSPDAPEAAASEAHRVVKVTVEISDDSEWRGESLLVSL